MCTQANAEAEKPGDILCNVEAQTLVHTQTGTVGEARRDSKALGDKQSDVLVKKLVYSLSCTEPEAEIKTVSDILGYVESE